MGAKALREAHYLQGRAARSYRAYKELLLRAIAFKSVGYTSAAAAELKFRWTKAASRVTFTKFVILVTLSATSGDQPYSFTVWTPAASFSAAKSIFRTALKTVRPLRRANPVALAAGTADGCRTDRGTRRRCTSAQYQPSACSCAQALHGEP